MTKDDQLQFDVTFESREAFEMFKLYAEAYNDCGIDKDALHRLLAHSKEFKKGMKNLITKLAGANNPSSLKS